MIIKGVAGQITVELVERISEVQYTGVTCSVEVTSAGFRGYEELVFFSREVSEKFLGDL